MIASICFAFLLGSPQLVTTKPNDPILVPSLELSAKGFYSKQVFFRGIPIVAAKEVDDRALRTIICTFDKMLAKVPDSVLEAMVKAGVHYSIIGKDQGQTDLPEYADLRNDPVTDWNKRARGLGGLYTSGGEENILELPSDRYVGESIFIHEFAHTLDAFGFGAVDKSFRKKLRTAYDSALKKRLWKNTYSASNPGEYWAEGVQMYFDCARYAVPSDGVHNEICNREGLKAYDPGLYQLVEEAFGKNPWRYEGKYKKTGVVPKSGKG